MSGEQKPEPRIDEQGRPWCSDLACNLHVVCKQPCVLGLPCLPAVREMAAELERLQAVVDHLPDIASIDGVIETMQESKRSHEQWAEYRQTNGVDSPDAGDLAFHQKCKSEYVLAISVLERVRKAVDAAKEGE